MIIGLVVIGLTSMGLSAAQHTANPWYLLEPVKPVRFNKFSDGDKAIIRAINSLQLSDKYPALRLNEYMKNKRLDRQHKLNSAVMLMIKLNVCRDCINVYLRHYGAFLRDVID